MQTIMGVVENHQIALKLRRVLVGLRGHVINGLTQFLPLASYHWLIHWHAKYLIKVWTQIHRNSGGHSHLILMHFLTQ